MYCTLLRGVYTGGNHPVAALKLLKMAVKWAPASGDPVAECQSCMRYFFIVGKAATNDNVRRFEIAALPKSPLT